MKYMQLSITAVISITLLTACNMQATTSQADTPATQAMQSLSKDMVVCPMVYDPICAKEIVNGKTVFNNYSNGCILNSTAKGKVVATTSGVCK